MSNSNAHDHYPLPVVIFGCAGGRYACNRHIVAAERTPMANLFLRIAEREGIELERFGDSTGAAHGLAPWNAGTFLSSCAELDIYNKERPCPASGRSSMAAITTAA